MAAIQTSPLAALSLVVSAGVTQITLNVLADSAAQDQTVDYNPGLYIDGAFSAELAVSNQAGINAIAVNLNGSAHTLEVWNGFQNFKCGSFVYSYSVTGGSGTVTVGGQAAIARRMVVYTDSIGCGALATTLTQNAWVARIRALFPGRITIEGWGGRALWDDSGTLPDMAGVGSFANLATRISTAARVGGASTREVWIQIGYNDWGFGGSGRWSAASYGAGMATLLDALHAADSGLRVYLASPVLSGTEGTTNSFGNTLANNRTQCSTAASGRAWVTFVDGTALMAASGVSSDTIHPTTVGHQAMALGTGASAGSTSIRTVLGI